MRDENWHRPSLVFGSLRASSCSTVERHHATIVLLCLSEHCVPIDVRPQVCPKYEVCSIMNKVEELVKFKRGRQVTIRLDVREWRRLRKRYERLKPLILAELSKLSHEAAAKWLTTPVPALKNRTPKQMFHPRRIQVLYSWFKKQSLTSTSTV